METILFYISTIVPTLLSLQDRSICHVVYFIFCGEGGSFLFLYQPTIFFYNLSSNSLQLQLLLPIFFF